MKSLAWLIVPGLAYAIFGGIFLLGPSGCQPDDSRDMPGQQELHQNAEAERNAIDEKANTLDHKAAAAPERHPIAVARKIVKEIDPHLERLAIAMALCLCASVGLCICGFGSIGKIGIAFCGGTGATAITLALALTQVPLLCAVGVAIFWICIAAGVAWIIYELYTHNWSPVETAEAIESDVTQVEGQTTAQTTGSTAPKSESRPQEATPSETTPKEAPSQPASSQGASLHTATPAAATPAASPATSAAGVKKVIASNGKSFFTMALGAKATPTTAPAPTTAKAH